MSLVENNGQFSDEGNRPDLSKLFRITPVMEAAYDNAKYEVIGQNKYMSKIVKPIIICFILLFILTFCGGARMAPVVVIVMVAMIIFAVITINKGGEKGVGVEEQYIKFCIEPLAKQIEPQATVQKSFSFFPLYGEVEDKTHSNNIYNGAYNNHTSLGKFLVTNCVIPQFNYSFKTEFVIDTLSANKEGFMFANATAMSRHRDSDGDSHTTTVFKGPIVVMRLSHYMRGEVSLYTSKKIPIFNKEIAYGYKKVNTIDTENDEFNKNFEVSANDEPQAFYVLSPLVMENLLALKNAYGDFGVHLDGGFLIIGFNLGRHVLTMPQSVKSAEKMNIRDTANEFATMLKMMYNFKDAVDLNFNNKL